MSTSSQARRVWMRSGNLLSVFDIRLFGHRDYRPIIAREGVPRWDATRRRFSVGRR